MTDLKLYTGPVQLVLAFDIGTTHSRVSYCILEPHHVPEVFTVTNFPAKRGVCKVPSLLYYDKAGAVRAAGAEVLSQDVILAAQAEGWTKAEWWKLHFRPKHLASAMDDLPQLPSGKSAIDILTDFIKYLFCCCKAYIQEYHPALVWSSVDHSIEFVLTYPDGWGDQRYLYRQAIERAGLIPSIPEGQLRVHTLTEGQAVLYFYVSHFSKKTVNQATPQGITVIDAGGGIINSSMFSVMPSPFSCEEIAPAESRLQGSVFVARRARALIERKLEGWERPNAEGIDEYINEFDQTTKLVIENDQEPAYVKLELSGLEATSLFNDSVRAIIDAFEQQKKTVATPITAAFLVGGLATNGWVWSQLQSYFNPQNITIDRPDHQFALAVAHGAVLSRIHANRLGAACTLYGLGYVPPVGLIDEAHLRKKTSLRDCLSRNITRILVPVRRCKWTERNATNFRVQAVRLMYHQDTPCDPKWLDSDRYDDLVDGQSPIPVDLRRTEKSITPSGAPAPNTRCIEKEPIFGGRLGCLAKSEEANPKQMGGAFHGDNFQRGSRTREPHGLQETLLSQ